MASRVLTYTFGALTVGAISILVVPYFVAPESTHSIFSIRVGVKDVTTNICVAALLHLVIKWMIVRILKGSVAKKESVYGLQHGRLHLQLPTPMWMNMGYWGEKDQPKTMAEACRDLLKTVLAEAGFSQDADQAEIANGERGSKLLIDVGFGCGDQTIYLMSNRPVRPCDRQWWDERRHCPQFDEYIGITKDTVQAGYAANRVEELKASAEIVGHGNGEKKRPGISLFCADAAKPASWNEQLRQRIDMASEQASDCWFLALDTAYHFSPSRWPVIQHACTNLRASFMAFDLCLSPDATITQKLVLRILTALMGAPWANFMTLEDYRRKLVDIGYSTDAISVVDVSHRVFTPLANFLEEQDTRLQTLGLGIGSLSVAKSMFNWWGRTGIVRGVIVVARR